MQASAAERAAGPVPSVCDSWKACVDECRPTSRSVQGAAGTARARRRALNGCRRPGEAPSSRGLPSSDISSRCRGRRQNGREVTGRISTEDGIQANAENNTVHVIWH